ncbi:MAG TPA: superoxide dismutase family protein [Bacteroidales bacterium]|nr:superoxide dismutase family protein [Bacteroidales bacterium]
MKKIKMTIQGLVVMTAFLVLSSCNPNSSQQVQQEASQMSGPEVTKAVCVLHPTEGNQVYGTVTFTKADSGIHVVAEVHGLTEGKHGFHIHEYGDCTAADGTSAGGHFNPEGVNHGGPNAAVRHVGDLGNITANADGNATLDMTDNMLSFTGKHSIIGRGIIVHAGEDDLTSQPTGNAGGRVACGVIGIAEEK